MNLFAVLLQSECRNLNLFTAFLVGVLLMLLQQLPPLAAHHHALGAGNVLHAGHQLRTKHGVTVSKGIHRAQLWDVLGFEGGGGQLRLTEAACRVDRQTCPSGGALPWSGWTWRNLPESCSALGAAG